MRAAGPEDRGVPPGIFVEKQLGVSQKTTRRMSQEAIAAGRARGKGDLEDGWRPCRFSDAAYVPG